MCGVSWVGEINHFKKKKEKKKRKQNFLEEVRPIHVDTCTQSSTKLCAWGKAKEDQTYVDEEQTDGASQIHPNNENSMWVSAHY